MLTLFPFLLNAGRNLDAVAMAAIPTDSEKIKGYHNSHIFLGKFGPKLIPEFESLESDSVCISGRMPSQGQYELRFTSCSDAARSLRTSSPPLTACQSVIPVDRTNTCYLSSSHAGLWATRGDGA